MLRGVLLALVFTAPLCVGLVFHRKDRAVGWGSLARAYLYGQFLMWAVFQLLAVPMIQLKTSFHLLVVIFTIIMAGFAVCGIVRLLKNRNRFELKIELPKSPLIWLLALATVGLILFQAYKYYAGMHIDQDDARYLGEANDAYYYNKMLLYQPETGEYLGNFSGVRTRDLFSPWPIYLAALSVLTTTIPPTFAHTFYAPVLLLLCYLAYASLGAKLFRNTSERIIFLFLVVVVHLYFSGPATVEGAPPVHTVTRIWQGKGVVNAVAIPAIFYQMLTIQEDDGWRNWTQLCNICCGACLLSGLGITLPIILVGLYGAYVIVMKRFNRIPLLIFSLLPSAVYQLLYYLADY